MNTQLTTTTANVPSTIVWPSEAVALMQLCKELSQARTLPPWCSRSPADLFFAVQSFVRLRLDPFMSLKHVSQIRNNLFFDGMLCAAMIHNSGKLAGNLSYEFTGEGDDRTVIVSGRLNNETEVRTVKVRLGDAKTEGNANWTKNPDQQLSYAGARMWGRRNVPEVLLGLLFDDEPMIDITPVAQPTEPVKVPLKTIHPAMSQAERSEIIDQETGEITERVPDVEVTDAERAATEPCEIKRTDDSAASWSTWATKFMAYVRASPDVATIKAWKAANTANLEALLRHDSGKCNKLEAMIEHQIAARQEDST